MNTKKNKKSKQIQISHEDFLNLMECFRIEKEMSIEMFHDQAEKAKHTKNISEDFEYIELSIYNYSFFNNLYKAFLEMDTNSNDKIITIKEKI